MNSKPRPNDSIFHSISFDLNVEHVTQYAENDFSFYLTFSSAFCLLLAADEHIA